MSPQVTAAVIAVGGVVLTVIATVAVQISGRRATSRDTQQALEEQRKQLDTTLAAQREQLDRTLAEQRTRTLNERFAAAAGQLGSDKPPEVRLAGVYAMAGLADDWQENQKNQQTCVDVLCAYLRMPYEPNPGQDAPGSERLAFRASREVRHTVIRVIAAHLRAGAAVSWQGLDFDFTGVVFDGGNFYGAMFSGGEVSFEYAEFFGGTVSFRGTEFSGGTVAFTGAKFSGSTVFFDRAKFSGGTVSFRGTEFSGGTVAFTGFAEFSGGMVSFDSARFSGSTVRFDSARFSGSQVDFDHAKFSGGTVDFVGAEFSGGKVDFSGGRVDFFARFAKLFGDEVAFTGGAEVAFTGGAEFSGSWVLFRHAQFSGEVDFVGAKFSGGTVDFMAARFSHGIVAFTGAEFSGSEVLFGGAEFSGGTVDFSQVAIWTDRPYFDWDSTPPSGVRLPKKEDQSQE